MVGFFTIMLFIFGPFNPIIWVLGPVGLLSPQAELSMIITTTAEPSLHLAAACQDPETAKRLVIAAVGVVTSNKSLGFRV